MGKSIVLAADPSRLAALLVDHVPMGTLPPHALPDGRLDVDHRSIYPFAVPNGSWI